MVEYNASIADCRLVVQALRVDHIAEVGNIGPTVRMGVQYPA